MSIPGLPSLPSDTAGLFVAVSRILSDAFGLGGGIAPQWGIFLNGAPVVLADNVISVGYKQDFSISNYPVEKGSFGSYNKVQHPFEIRVVFSKGGSDSDIQAFLDSIQNIITDTNLYDFVTPSAVYTNVNVTHQDYERSSHKGLGLVMVDVGCEEVRPATLASSSTTTSSSTSGGAATTTSTSSSLTPNQIVANDFAVINQPQSPTAAAPVNGGQASPVTPFPGQFDLSQALP